MRKYVIGALVGAALTFSIQAGATVILTGSKVAGTKEVTLGGQAIGQAAIINSTSYLPVRALSDALGLQIDLSGGKINLTTPTTPQPTPSSGPATTPTPTPAGTQYSILEVDSAIATKTDQIAMWQRIVDKNAALGLDDQETRAQKRALDDLKAELAIWQQRKAESEGK